MRKHSDRTRRPRAKAEAIALRAARRAKAEAFLAARVAMEAQGQR